MAIYHLSAKPVKRSTGRSATAAAAYRAAEKIPDERTGEEHDYTRKKGVEHSEIVLPDYAARNDINWARDRAALWNAAEKAEVRKDARVAREYELALPAELNAQQRIELVREFSQEIANRHGAGVDFAIHAPHRDGDQRNHHAHVLATTRRIMPTGLGDKTTIELSDTDRKKRGLGPASTEIEAIRERWAQLSNQALARHGHEARIDHRSLAAQREEAQQRGDAEKAAELDREPTKHLGVAATAMERRGETTDLGDINRRIAEAAEAGRLERERQAMDASIFDLSGDLSAALRERDKLREQASQASPRTRADSDLALDARRQAREAWASMRDAGKVGRQSWDAMEQSGGMSKTTAKATDRQKQKDGFHRDGPQNDGIGREGQSQADIANATGRKPLTLGGFAVDRGLMERAAAIGGRAADPQEMERLLREWLLEQQQQRDKQQNQQGDRKQAGTDPTKNGPENDPKNDAGSGRQRTQSQQLQRERDIEHRRHRDRGLDR
jgi:hypothetical protein